MAIYHYECKDGHETVLCPIGIEAPETVECHTCGTEAEYLGGESASGV